MVATQAYIAYVHSKGHAPKNANHFINFCKSHEPPFIGVNYKKAKQIIAQPPSITPTDQPQQVQNPYLDTSLIQNITQEATKSTINDIYELHKQKREIYPNNAMEFLSFCETNNFNTTYSECSRFLSTKPKQKQRSRVRALSMISATNKSGNETQRERTKSVGRLNANSIWNKMQQIQLDTDQQRLNELKQQKNIKNAERINADAKVDKMVKETEEKHESQIEQMKCENQHIQQLNTTSTMIQQINENLKNKKPMENISNPPDINQLAIEGKVCNNIKLPKTKQSEFLSEDKFTKNVINCTKSNDKELSDNFIHIRIDSNNSEKIKEAINVATTRAFQSRLVEPVNNISKGKLFGEMSMLLPSGLTNKHEFNGENVYHATATFKQSDMDSKETFKSDMYYDEVSFNPIYKSTNDEKSAQASFTDNNTNISCAIHADSSYNKLNDEVAVKLQQEYLSKMDESNKANKVYNSENIPSSEIFKISTTGPKESCRAHFTGCLVGGTYIYYQVSLAYKIDQFSEYVGQGEYPRNRDAFPKAVANTFDGIAIDHKTRVIIYEKENFEGKKLLDAKGPKIVLNGIWKNDQRLNHCKTDIFPDPELQKNFPVECRMWTETNMHDWSYGSVKILSNSLNE